MFGHASDPTRVYAYGAKPPRGRDADLIREQIDRQWRYRNDLVARELARRADTDALIREHYPALVELDAMIEDRDREIEAGRERVQRAKAAARSKDVVSPEARARLRAIRAERRELYQEHRELRKQAYADPAVRAALDGIDAHDLADRKRLRAASGLHWGSYLTVEQALSGIRRGAPPRFVRRSDWQGKLAVQIQGGATWDELVAGHGQCRVEPEPLPEGATPGGRRSKRPYHRLFLRVGSDGRAPIWARTRFVLHRPIPADGRVKWIYLVRRSEGTSETWSVQFVVARSSWSWQDTHTAMGACAVHLGWRQVEDGIRVATMIDGAGRREELVVPHDRLTGMDKADSLEGIRDRELSLARETLVHWLATADVPDWLREATRTLAQWRSQARLASLAIAWRGQRFAGDAEAFDALEAWRKQDRHLCDWAAAERAKFRRWRDDAYRRFAARLRWTYETVLIDGTDWRKMARTPAPEEDTDRLNTRRAARLAAPGRLREVIEAGHPDVRRVDPAGITTTCSLCGADAHPEWDRVREIAFRCHAGHRLDQDENAARNMLARHASGEVVAG